MVGWVCRMAIPFTNNQCALGTLVCAISKGLLGFGPKLDFADYIVLNLDFPAISNPFTLGQQRPIALMIEREVLELRVG